MARCLFSNNLIFQVLFGIALINEISPYENIFLESSKLCSLKDNDSITAVNLGRGKNSAKAVVHSYYFERWSGKYSFFCSFSVNAPRKHGIYAVIQNLNLRKDQSTGLCKDYVEIEVPQKLFLVFFTKAPKVAKKFCGKISPKQTHTDLSKDIDYNNQLRFSPVAENGFVTEGDKILVKIYIAKEKLKSDEKLNISIVFTAFENDCKTKDNAIQCRECEWIWDNLALDKIQNCPYTSCLDENFCESIGEKNEVRNIVSSGTGTKVSIGAVATIILVLLMFACCIWISRRMQLWCFHPNGSRQSRMEMNPTVRTAGIEDNNLHYGEMLPNSIAPSAPPIPEDKDLPPSYSSLFPGK